MQRWPNELIWQSRVPAKVGFLVYEFHGEAAMVREIVSRFNNSVEKRVYVEGKLTVLLFAINTQDACGIK